MKVKILNPAELDPKKLEEKYDQRKAFHFKALENLASLPFITKDDSCRYLWVQEREIAIVLSLTAALDCKPVNAFSGDNCCQQVRRKPVQAES